MTDTSTLQLVDLDWNEQALWVQDRTMYLLLEGQDPDGDMIELQDQVGNKVTLSRAELEETHTPVRQATIYKTKYAPVQAFCPREDSLLRLSDQEYVVPAGDALMRNIDGRFSVMPRHEFNCRYQFVAAAGPTAPFS